MPMDSKQFEKNVLVYGADLDQWPEEARQSRSKGAQKIARTSIIIRRSPAF